jgi:hypothetical protein
MDHNLLLIEEIHDVINKKVADCNCNPCNCPEETKDEYFRELKDILTKYNREYLHLNDISINLFDQGRIQFHFY